VAAGSGERLVAWQSDGEIWAARPARGGKRWERVTLDTGPQVRALLAVGISAGGIAQVIWRTDTGVTAAHASPGAGRFSRAAVLALPPSTSVSSAGVAVAGERAIVAWHDATTGAVGAAMRRSPSAEWEAQVVTGQAGGAPVAATNAAGLGGLSWRAATGVPVMARRAPGGLWEVRPGVGIAAGAPDIQINRRGALLVQWDPVLPSTTGGAYHPANRDRWLPTDVARGRGYLRRREVAWINAERERLRKGLPKLVPDADMQVFHVDERGDVFGTVTDSRTGSLTLLQHPERRTSRWSTKAVSAIGIDRPRIAANARGDVVVAFLTPSEFVPGTLNSGIATTSSAIGVRGVQRPAKGRSFILRAAVPDKGRLTIVMRRSGRVIRTRSLTVGRRPQFLRLRAPRATGVLRLELTLRTPDGRSYSAPYIVRVR